MGKKVIELKTSRSKFFRQYLELVKIFHPFNTLRHKELDVLAELFYYNNEYKHLDRNTRWKLILHYDNREAIKEKYTMSDANFNNILTALRKKDLLIDNKVPQKYLLETDDEFEFKINFKINE